MSIFWAMKTAEVNLESVFFLPLHVQSRFGSFMPLPFTLPLGQQGSGDCRHCRWS